MTRSLLLCFLFYSLALSSHADDVVPPPPIYNIGRAITWDGRVSINPVIRDDSDGNTIQALRAYAFRPGKIREHSVAGYPDLTDVFRPSPHNVEFTRNGELYFMDPDVERMRHFSVSVNPHGEDTLLSNPYTCGEDGVANFQGDFECYRMLLYIAMTRPDEPNVKRMHGQYAKVRVRAFNSTSHKRLLEPYVVEAELLSDPIPMHWGGEQNSQHEIRGWEPTSDASGRLLILQGRRFTYNFSKPFNLQQWSEPDSLTNMHLVNDSYEGLTFAERFPIAKEPLRDAQGRLCNDCGGQYHWISQDGSDLTFVRTHYAYEDGRQIVRGGFSLVGQSTDYVETLIDGPINNARLDETGFSTSPGKLSGLWPPYTNFRTAYFPFNKANPGYPIFSIFKKYDEVSVPEFLDRDYAFSLRMNELVTDDEVSPEGDYQLLPNRTYMHVSAETTVDKTRTPDVSGNFNTGRLENGAKFPTEFNRSSGKRPKKYTENVGYVGRAVYMTPGARIRIPIAPQASINSNANTSVIDRSFGSLGLEMAFNVNRFRKNMNLFYSAGAVRILIAKRRKLAIRVKIGGSIRTLRSRKKLRKNRWYHIGLVFRPVHKKALLYINGELSDTFPIPTGLITFRNDILLGPANLGTQQQGKSLYLLDEVAMSRARPAYYYYQRAARRKNQVTPRVWNFITPAQLSAELPESLQPPVGLDPWKLRLPRAVAEVIEAGKFDEAVALGDEIFHDTNLTGQDISCATCHQANSAFTDSRSDNQFSEGVGGARTRRNAPTTMNRAFSTAQFFDGRSASLVTQALEPIENENEMNGTAAEVLQYLNGQVAYRSQFQSIFSGDANEARLGIALAAFQMTLMTGDTLPDQIHAGELTGAFPGVETWQQIRRGEALFFGRARCSACHLRGNYTDEKFHNIGTATSEDTGRVERTGATSDFGAFKTPTLREIDKTAPYMHDGSMATLEEVIEHYLTIPRIDDPLHDLEFKPIELNTQERQDLIAFLEAL